MASRVTPAEQQISRLLAQVQNGRGAGRVAQPRARQGSQAGSHSAHSAASAALWGHRAARATACRFMRWSRCWRRRAPSPRWRPACEQIAAHAGECPPGVCLGLEQDVLFVDAARTRRPRGPPLAPLPLPGRAPRPCLQSTHAPVPAPTAPRSKELMAGVQALREAAPAFAEQKLPQPALRYARPRPGARAPRKRVPAHAEACVASMAARSLAFALFMFCPRFPDSGTHPQVHRRGRPPR